MATMTTDVVTGRMIGELRITADQDIDPGFLGVSVAKLATGRHTVRGVRVAKMGSGERQYTVTVVPIKPILAFRGSKRDENYRVCGGQLDDLVRRVREAHIPGVTRIQSSVWIEE